MSYTHFVKPITVLVPLLALTLAACASPSSGGDDGEQGTEALTGAAGGTCTSAGGTTDADLLAAATEVFGDELHGQLLGANAMITVPGAARFVFPKDGSQKGAVRAYGAPAVSFSQLGARTQTSLIIGGTIEVNGADSVAVARKLWDAMTKVTPGAPSEFNKIYKRSTNGRITCSQATEDAAAYSCILTIASQPSGGNPSSVVTTSSVCAY